MRPCSASTAYIESSFEAPGLQRSRSSNRWPHERGINDGRHPASRPGPPPRTLPSPNAAIPAATHFNGDRLTAQPARKTAYQITMCQGQRRSRLLRKLLHRAKCPVRAPGARPSSTRKLLRLTGRISGAPFLSVSARNPAVYEGCRRYHPARRTKPVRLSKLFGPGAIGRRRTLCVGVHAAIAKLLGTNAQRLQIHARRRQAEEQNVKHRLPAIRAHPSNPACAASASSTSDCRAPGQRATLPPAESACQQHRGRQETPHRVLRLRGGKQDRRETEYHDGYGPRRRRGRHPHGARRSSGGARTMPPHPCRTS